jgi:pSer/pThr/pTyr-binding forkhead associated (FHA) protein
MTGIVLLVLRVLMAVALYAFLFLALWVLWRDLRRQARQEARPGTPVLSLVRHAAEEDTAHIYRFDIAEVVIGRDPTCSLRLDDKTISARHARLSYHHRQWWVDDLHSTNGTFLNTEGVTEPIVIASGDLLRCGAVEFDITMES